MQEEWALIAPIRLKIAQMAHLMDMEEIRLVSFGLYDGYSIHVRNAVWQLGSRVPVHCNCTSCVYKGMMDELAEVGLRMLHNE